MQEHCSDPKGFVVLGLPRSGTTFLCKTLDQFKDVSFPISYEPFHVNDISGMANYYNVSVLDYDSLIDKLPPNKYMGFKTFPFYHLDILDMISNYNLFVIGMLRKNIWKSLGSLLAAIENSDDFNNSSKPMKYCYNNSRLEQNFIIITLHRYLTNIDFIEKNFHQNVIYYEDFVNQDYSNDVLNTFFNRQITIRTDYDDSHHPSQYFVDFEPVKKLVLDHLDKNIITYEKIPSWALDNLYNV